MDILPRLNLDDKVFVLRWFGTTGFFSVFDNHGVGIGPILARLSVRVAKNRYRLSVRIDIGANLLVVNMATNPDGIVVEHV